MNPADMLQDSITEGATVEVASPYGRVRGIAVADKTMRQRVIAIPHQRAHGDDVAPGRIEGFTGVLVSLDDQIQKINFMPRQSGIPVNVASI
jgi:anaerobic selenocysteine-containing dehydrogenase